ncbi:MAG TPA: O-acetyl-ADP-ribose deacetylase [Conexivisphaerales archaeon]|nr:O-acetyl-ADP-ribose deacetylase [Conexivisphaerales archaeon]
MVGDTVLRLVLGDITEQRCDVIVNAANSGLLGGGGVDGAIHRKGGPAILDECKRIRASRFPSGLPAGAAVHTAGGNLAARYIIHAVGPVWKGGAEGEGELLSRAYRNSLDIADSLGVSSIAFPSISTGAYGYPIEKAVAVALDAVLDYLLKGERSVKEVRFVLFSAHDYEVYEKALSNIKMPIA